MKIPDEIAPEILQLLLNRVVHLGRDCPSETSISPYLACVVIGIGIGLAVSYLYGSSRKPNK